MTTSSGEIVAIGRAASTAGFTDDMVDQPQWLGHPILREDLLMCRDLLFARYHEWDGEALDAQQNHFNRARFVARFALLAILLALVQVLLQRLDHLFAQPRWLNAEPVAAVLVFLEFVFGLLAVVTVVRGRHAATHEGWLLARHKAERVRFLKFSYLTSPMRWPDSPTTRQTKSAWLQDQMTEIEQITEPLMRAWVQADKPPTPPTVSAASRTRDESIGVRDYYRETRFWGQHRYFADKAEPPKGWFRVAPKLPQTLFFVTTAVIAFHLVLSAIEKLLHREPPTELTVFLDTFSIALVVLAIALPSWGSAIRTYRIAREGGRNAMRSQAKAAALEALAKPLLEAKVPAVIFTSLWACEEVLMADHREWLRLMIDAEWFG